MNINKIAAKDAAKWARAEMFFGEGAGTRRKLLGAEIAHKTENVPGYQKAFSEFYSNQNFADHAIAAAKERQRIDRVATVNKNTKAVLRGDRRSMSTGVLIVAGIGYVAHQTGYDKVILTKSKVYYNRANSKIRSEIKKAKAINAANKIQRDPRNWN